MPGYRSAAGKAGKTLSHETRLYLAHDETGRMMKSGMTPGPNTTASPNSEAEAASAPDSGMMQPNTMMGGNMMAGGMMTGGTMTGGGPMAANARGSEMMISAEEIAELALRADTAAELLRTLANRYRIMILCHLAIQERSVTELAGLVGMNISALSQHLSRLRRDQLVLTRRSAHQIFYRIGEGSVREIMQVLYHVYCRKVEAMQQSMQERGMMNTGMMSAGMPQPMPAMQPGSRSVASDNVSPDSDASE